MREMADRRMYTMRAELKISFKAKQRAQQNEKRQLDAKRRFSSYIFHEVRVPLNTALLAVQNLQGLNVFDKNSEFAIEYSALEGSLAMMSQVLNVRPRLLLPLSPSLISFSRALETDVSMLVQDVLDFSRMERGGFSSVSRPFSLHNVMRSIFVPLRLDAASRGLQLDTSLDLRVDQLAVRAAEIGPGDASTEEGDGFVMGDEMRLRQILANLVSNAAKFTPSGGRIGIKTELIYPTQEDELVKPQYLPDSTDFGELERSPTKGDDEGALTDDTLGGGGGAASRLTPNRLQEHEATTGAPTGKEMMVVRFEVSDTGVGIRKSDMAENRCVPLSLSSRAVTEDGKLTRPSPLARRLFSPYVQTAVGREQGGKGTGLGLSLVRQIVMLSGGRLGVRSKVGEGSTFFVELPFAIGKQTREDDGQPALNQTATRRPGTSTSTLEKQLKGDTGTSTAAVTPGTDSSTASDYRFVDSLRKRSSDPTLDSIDESTPSSPGRAASPMSEPPSPSVFTSPPNVATPHLFLSGQSTPTSGPSFTHPFGGSSQTLRPAPHSHISSSSAPAEVTRAPSQTSAPVVSPKPLPARATPRALAPKPGAGKLEFADGPLKVLVVDDDTLTRKLMSRMMQRLGCEVETAENGKIALDMILAAPPPGAVLPAGRDDETSLADSESPRGSPSLARVADFDAAERGMGNGGVVGGVLKHGGSRRGGKRVGLPGPPDSAYGVDAYQHYAIVFLDNQMPVCSGVQVVQKLRQLGRDDLVVGVTANARASLSSSLRARSLYLDAATDSCFSPSCSPLRPGAVPRVGRLVHPHQAVRLLLSSLRALDPHFLAPC